MTSYKKHHYVPKFLLNQWANSDKKLWLYLKNDLSISPIMVSTADIGLKENLYTSTGGDKSVESKFFTKIDDKASKVLEKILVCKMLSEDDKMNFTHFIATFHLRSPDFVKEIKVNNEIYRKIGLKYAEKYYETTGIDDRKLFEKKKYDDTPKIIQLGSTIGTQTAMSESYEKDFLKIMNLKWEYFVNDTDNNFLCSDFPLRLIQFSTEKSNGFDLPESFGITLPISPKMCLIITNKNNFFKQVVSGLKKDFIKQTNISIIKSAKNQIFSNESALNNFMLNVLKVNKNNI